MTGSWRTPSFRNGRRLGGSSTAKDTFNARKNDSYVGGTGFNNHATGFDKVYADVLSGDDRAYFNDWTGDDTFWSRNGTARLFDTALALFHNEVTGFESSLDKIIINGTAGGTNTLDVVGIDYVLQNDGGF